MTHVVVTLVAGENLTSEQATRFKELADEHLEFTFDALHAHGSYVFSHKGQDETEEEDISHFLVAVGREFPGVFTGVVEVWWPFAIETGPVKFELKADGTVERCESDIVWDHGVLVS